MLDIQPIVTENLHLIPYKEKFDEYIIRLHNESGFMVYDDNDPVKSKEQYIGYIHSLIDTNVAVMWMVKHGEFKINLGIIYLTDIIQGITANLHPVIDRKGYKIYLQMNGGSKLKFMEEAAMPVIKYGFDKFKLQRVGGGFFEHNRFAISFVKKLGFRQEGFIRHGTKIKDEPQNLIILGILKEEVK